MRVCLSRAQLLEAKVTREFLSMKDVEKDAEYFAKKTAEQEEGFFFSPITRSKALDVIRRHLESGQLRVVWHQRELSQWCEI